MSIPDDAMREWHRLLAMGDWTELGEDLARLDEGQGDPMALKHALAHAIVTRIHDVDAADAARESFRRVVQRKQMPHDVPEISIALDGRDSIKLVALLREADLVGSNSEARRLVQQGAVSIDGVREEDPTRPLAAGTWLVQVGKRRYVRISLA